MKHRPPLRVHAGVLLAGMLCTTMAQAAMVWSPHPAQSAEPVQRGEHQHDEGVTLYLHQGPQAALEMWQPDLSRQPLTIGEHGKVVLPSSGMNNYHAVTAQRHEGALVETALRYVPNMRGKESGHSPAELTAAPKVDLEIVPDPLPREHARYQTQQQARFRLTWQGQPLPNVPLVMTTAHGSRLETRSDADGGVIFTLPDDFPEVKPGRRNNRPAEFVVQTAYHQDGSDYHTTLSAAYHVNPSHWQSTGAALIVLSAGFLSGIGLLRRYRTANT